MRAEARENAVGCGSFTTSGLRGRHLAVQHVRQGPAVGFDREAASNFEELVKNELKMRRQ